MMWIKVHALVVTLSAGGFVATIVALIVLCVPSGRLATWIRLHFLALELAVCALLTAAFFIWIHWGDGATAVDGILATNRGAIYGALAAVFGSLLGFSITAVSVVMLISQDPRMTMVRESKHYKTMWDVFTKGIFALAAATATALLALVMDRDCPHSRFAMTLALGTSLLALARLFSCVWLLEQLVTIVRGEEKG
jgi:hypothetical protein